MKPRNPVPSYLKHKQSGRARAVWTDAGGTRRERLLPGPFDSPESRAAHARLILELATSPAVAVVSPAALTVNEVLVAYKRYAEGYYTGDGGKEFGCMMAAIRPVRELYGPTPAAAFGPVALKAVRQRMIDAGLCRAVINRRVDRIRRVFKWAVAEELVPPSVHQALRTLDGLRKGRTAARETEPVKPVPDAAVDATLPHLPPHVRAAVELLRLTGMRPSEACGMTLGQIDRSGPVWVYRPVKHKTAHADKARAIPLGPKARAVLVAHLAGRTLDPDAPLFSPHAAREERFAAMRAGRKTKVQPSQLDRRKAAPKKLPAARYSPGSIAHAVAAGCRKAFPPPAPLAKRPDESAKQWQARLTAEQRAALRAWERAHRWFPYQLRHSFGTRVRREHGLEAAQVALGHARADVTQVYAEKNLGLAVEVASRLG